MLNAHGVLPQHQQLPATYGAASPLPAKPSSDPKPGQVVPTGRLKSWIWLHATMYWGYPNEHKSFPSLADCEWYQNAYPSSTHGRGSDPQEAVADGREGVHVNDDDDELDAHVDHDEHVDRVDHDHDHEKDENALIRRIRCNYCAWNRPYMRSTSAAMRHLRAAHGLHGVSRHPGPSAAATRARKNRRRRHTSTGAATAATTTASTTANQRQRRRRSVGGAAAAAGGGGGGEPPNPKHARTLPPGMMPGGDPTGMHGHGDAVLLPPPLSYQLRLARAEAQTPPRPPQHAAGVTVVPDHGARVHTAGPGGNTPRTPRALPVHQHFLDSWTHGASGPWLAEGSPFIAHVQPTGMIVPSPAFSGLALPASPVLITPHGSIPYAAGAGLRPLVGTALAQPQQLQQQPQPQQQPPAQLCSPVSRAASVTTATTATTGLTQDVSQRQQPQQPPHALATLSHADVGSSPLRIPVTPQPLRRLHFDSPVRAPSAAYAVRGLAASASAAVPRDDGPLPSTGPPPPPPMYVGLPDAAAQAAEGIEGQGAVAPLASTGPPHSDP